MTEIVEIELQTIEDQQYTINRTRRWTPVVIFTIGIALVIAMLGVSMLMTGLRSNSSETEGGLVVPKTNLGLQNDPNLVDPSPESHDEQVPNDESWASSTNRRTRRFIIGEPDWDPKIQWKINKERYDRIRDNRDHWNGKGPAYWNAFDVVAGGNLIKT